MVLLGVICGFFSITKFSSEHIRTIMLDYKNYLILLIISGIYVCLFKKIYKDGGLEPDWLAIFIKILAESVKFLIAYVLSMAFVLIIGF
jgi:hypothetical protein